MKNPWLAFASLLAQSKLDGGKQDLDTVKRLLTAFQGATAKALRGKRPLFIFCDKDVYLDAIMHPENETEYLAIWNKIHDKMDNSWFHYLEGPRWHFTYLVLNRLYECAESRWR